MESLIWVSLSEGIGLILPLPFLMERNIWLSVRFLMYGSATGLTSSILAVGVSAVPVAPWHILQVVL